MRSFLRGFWISLSAVVIVGSLAVHVWWRTQLMNLPIRPPFPFTRDTYVAAYGDEGYVVHYLYRYGIFGMRKKMQQADVLLLGPSHVELGLSAAQLSDELTVGEGRPIRAYNLGIGYGDSLAFDRGVLAANFLDRKEAVVDLFMPNGERLSPFARQVEESSSLGAYLYVTNLWLRVIEDWALDSWLPSFRPPTDAATDARIGPIRRLQSVFTRSWNTGDAVNIWRPETGFIYAPSPPGWTLPFRVDDPNKQVFASYVMLTPGMQAALEERKIRAVYTLVPFPSYLPHQVPAAARPYIPLASEGLTFVDSNHLNASSRKLVTERLFQGMKQADILKSWSVPPFP